VASKVMLSQFAVTHIDRRLETLIISVSYQERLEACLLKMPVAGQSFVDGRRPASPRRKCSRLMTSPCRDGPPSFADCDREQLGIEKDNRYARAGAHAIDQRKKVGVIFRSGTGIAEFQQAFGSHKFWPPTRKYPPKTFLEQNPRPEFM
jgi:hypothetical protein